ncbi:helix-turn-helix transcriptional regulator [Escherichia coli]
MTTPVSLMDDQMVDMAFITQLTGLTDKWFYKLIKDGAFPAPIKLGRSSRWLKSEVEAWLHAHRSPVRNFCPLSVHPQQT